MNRDTYNRRQQAYDNKSLADDLVDEAIDEKQNNFALLLNKLRNDENAGVIFSSCLADYFKEVADNGVDDDQFSDIEMLFTQWDALKYPRNSVLGRIIYDALMFAAL
jgi:hypothetical protein